MAQAARCLPSEVLENIYLKAIEAHKKVEDEMWCTIDGNSTHSLTMPQARPHYPFLVELWEEEKAKTVDEFWCRIALLYRMDDP